MKEINENQSKRAEDLNNKLKQVLVSTERPAYDKI